MRRGPFEVELANVIDLLRLRPDAEIFVTRRAWDQRAEAGYMKQIEDGYQVLAERIIADRDTPLTESENEVATHYYALCFVRSQLDLTGQTDVQLNAVTGHEYTKDEEEMLEKGGVSFIRKDGTLPLRQMVGLRLQKEINSICMRWKYLTWGIVDALEGEFIHPDTSQYLYIPVTPKTALVGGLPNGSIPKHLVTESNRKAQSRSKRYIFARSMKDAF